MKSVDKFRIGEAVILDRQFVEGEPEHVIGVIQAIHANKHGSLHGPYEVMNGDTAYYCKEDELTRLETPWISPRFLNWIHWVG